jgi:hypothetical protein
VARAVGTIVVRTIVVRTTVARTTVVRTTVVRTTVVRAKIERFNYSISAIYRMPTLSHLLIARRRH